MALTNTKHQLLCSMLRLGHQEMAKKLFLFCILLLIVTYVLLMMAGISVNFKPKFMEMRTPADPVEFASGTSQLHNDGILPIPEIPQQRNDAILPQMEMTANTSSESSEADVWSEPADNIDCQRVFHGDFAYAREKRFEMKDPPAKQLPMDCESIRRRSRLELGWAGSEEEQNFSLAFARIVYKDYLLLEQELATNYAPQNWYCFVVDSKSNVLFRLRIRLLAQCFSNVVVVKREFSITKDGHNTSNAMVECARELARPERKWEYFVTLQNHDIQAKTNAELVKIYKRLDGANDIEVGFKYQTVLDRISFYQKHFNWTFHSLKLFKNETKNVKSLALDLSKGYSTASLSRQFIDFIVHQLNLDKLLEQFNLSDFGVDEHLWQSLSNTPALDAPGGFIQQCYELGKKTPYITRFALWGMEDNGVKCRSGRFRHGVCVFGLEDLTSPKLFELPYLFLNKMMPEQDAGVLKCWHEWMREKRLTHSEQQLDPKPYTNWPQTRYNQLRRQSKDPIPFNETMCM